MDDENYRKAGRQLDNDTDIIIFPTHLEQPTHFLNLYFRVCMQASGQENNI